MKDYEALSRKHFDQQAAEYDARDTVYYSREGKISCRDIAEMLKDTFYESLLDVGCGTGFLIDMLAQQRTARYTGLDLSYPYPEKAMSEAFRVLKKGGLYILSDTGVGGLGGWIDNNILFRLSNSGDCHTTNRKGIAQMMEKTGFHVKESRQVQGFIYTVTGRKQA